MLEPRKSLLVIFMIVGCLYAQVSRAFFCGYDDFVEIQRAAFEDTQNPSRMLTTTHFGTSKYRPLNRLFIYLTYHLGGGKAVWFRLRNLAFHLLAVAMVYGIGWCLFQSGACAFAGALLFGVSPLANQCVVASSWTVNAADALLLAALFLFLRADARQRTSLLWAALACIWPALFLYEPALMLFPIAYAFLAIAWLWRGKRPTTSFLLHLTLVTLVAAGSFFAARILVHVPKSPVLPIASILRNSAMYAADLLTPVDPILANQAFGAPLPSEMDRAMLVTFAGVAVAVALALALLFVFSTTLRGRLAKVDWPVAVFLALCIPVSLAPFLLFTEHASETYLYLPSALYSLLLAGMVRALASPAWVATAILAVFALSFVSGTWLRNQDVAACGATAQRILAGLPLEHWTTGSWSLRFASVPGEPRKTRYGIYEYLGISTIDVGDPSMSAMSAALQLATHNPGVAARIVSPAEMDEDCSPPAAQGIPPAQGIPWNAQLCFWVHDDGEVASAGAPK